MSVQKVEFIQSHLMELGIINIKMKLLLLPLLAVLVLPNAVNANFYDKQVFKQRWPVFVDNFSNGTKFQELED